MGTPLADDEKRTTRGVDVGAIFFFFPYWLAQRRLRENDLAADFRRSLAESLLATRDPVTRLQFRRDNRLDAYLQGRKFFTWERSILCPICLHWWLTLLLIIAAFAAPPISWVLALPGQLALAYLVTHLFIRKIA